ncbi:hypothetical protein I4F81_002772 [Pyropia yezoensis]|uniref:Uncharacterized protein n=1 Tax=Pyropia yezoensis TaxID=2788 RepID=A0ACC3BQH3_PYRYE|nr:hypothetical protein I4F81_002772 [Neopyropia yezoensis]
MGVRTAPPSCPPLCTTVQYLPYRRAARGGGAALPPHGHTPNHWQPAAAGGARQSRPGLVWSGAHCQRNVFPTAPALRAALPPPPPPPPFPATSAAGILPPAGPPPLPPPRRVSVVWGSVCPLFGRPPCGLWPPQRRRRRGAPSFVGRPPAAATAASALSLRAVAQPIAPPRPSSTRTGAEGWG